MSVKSLYYLYFVVAIAACIAAFPDGFMAVALSASVSIPIIFILKKTGDRADDLLKIFLVAVIVRTFVSTAIYVFQITDFFALDWKLYNEVGLNLANYWTGKAPLSDLAKGYI